MGAEKSVVVSSYRLEHVVSQMMTSLYYCSEVSIESDPDYSEPPKSSVVLLIRFLGSIHFQKYPY